MEFINSVVRVWENAAISESGVVIPGNSQIKVVAKNYNLGNGFGHCEEVIYQDGQEISFDDSLAYVSGYNDPLDGHPGYPNGYGFRLI